MEQKRNSLALFGFVLGMISLFFQLLGIVPLTAIIVNAVALKQFNVETENNRWMAISGLVIALISFVITVVAIIILVFYTSPLDPSIENL